MLPVQRAVPAVSQAVPTAMRPMRTEYHRQYRHCGRQDRWQHSETYAYPGSDRKACHKTGYVYAQACCEACGNRKAYSGSYTGTGAG